MNSDERYLITILFKNKIYKSNGKEFEDLFTTLMEYTEDGFRKIKPWGNIGDRKNDGYIPSKGEFYQVYAPEDIDKSYYTLLSKINEDFHGLLNQWNNVKTYYFVLNDKYNGVHPDASKTLDEIKKNHKLDYADFIRPINLENRLFTLSRDRVLLLIGHIPNINEVRNINLGVLQEVINYIMRSSLFPTTSEIKYPDWDDKIRFNKLSEVTKYYLNLGIQQQGLLDEYLSTNPFVAEDLQSKMAEIYSSIKEEWKDIPNLSGDNIFWEIVSRCIPKQESMYQSATFPIISKYFESCDIFEEPK